MTSDSSAPHSSSLATCGGCGCGWPFRHGAAKLNSQREKLSLCERYRFVNRELGDLGEELRRSLSGREVHQSAPLRVSAERWILESFRPTILAVMLNFARDVGRSSKSITRHEVCVAFGLVQRVIDA